MFGTSSSTISRFPRAERLFDDGVLTQWRCFFAVMALGGLASSILQPPIGFWLPVVQTGLAWTASATILIELRVAGATRDVRLPWSILAAAVAVPGSSFLVADLATDPGMVPALLQLAGPLIAAVGLILMVRTSSRRADWAAVVDALIVTAGIGLVFWLLQIEPVLDKPGATRPEQFFPLAFAVVDLMLFASTVLLLRTTGPRAGLGTRIMTAAFGLFLLTDWIPTVAEFLPVIDAAWVARLAAALPLAGIALLGWAARYPGEAAGPVADADGVSVPQFGGLGVAVLIAPVTLFVQATWPPVTDGRAIAVSSAIIWSLVLVRVMQLLQRSQRATRQVRELSLRDPLTGVANRRAWTERLNAALESARRTGKQLTVGILDLDHFKLYNDRHGHPAGDLLLKEASAAWSEQLRETDTLARYGGEEFTVLLPGVSPGEAAQILDRLRQVTPDRATFSAGLAAWTGSETADELVGRADAALYQAKQSGRDRVCGASPA